MRAIVCSLMLLYAGTLFGQQSSDSKPRVFITDSQSWEISGGFGGSDAGFGGATKGGARPQTGEVIKTFGERCPQVTINNLREKADYVVLLDHEGGKSVIVRDNKVAVFNHDGDSIVSGSTRSLGNAVKNACDAITADWPKQAQKRANAALTKPADPQGDAAVSSATRIAVSSNPATADIELDGSFVGNTPSSIQVTPGEHVVVIKKAGYQDWQRKMKVTGGTINISADLEKAQ